MKRHAMGALAALLILTLTACSRPLTGGMGIALPGGNSGWAAAVTHEAQAWAQSLEAPHQLVTAKEAVTQEKQLLQLAAQGASVIVWSPVEDQPMPDSLAQGKTAVVTFRRSAPTAGDALLTQDPAALGAMQAQTLAALLGETGRTARLAGQEDAAWQEAFALGGRGRWCLYHAGYLALAALAYTAAIFAGTLLFTLLPLRNFDYALGWEAIARILPIQGVSPGGLVLWLYGMNFLRFYFLALGMWLANLYTERLPAGVLLVLALGILDRALGLEENLLRRAGLLMSQNAALMELPAMAAGEGVTVPFGRLILYWSVLITSLILVCCSRTGGMDFGGGRGSIGMESL